MNQAKRRIIAIALTAVIFLGFCAGMITVVAICGPHPLGWLAAAGAVFGSIGIALGMFGVIVLMGWVWSWAGRR